jgi:hypothetical protein
MFKKFFAVFLSSLLALSALFWLNEPSSVEAASASDTVNVQLDVTSEITISDTSHMAILSGTIPGMTGGSAQSASSTKWTVTTNNSSGYQLTLTKNQKLTKVGTVYVADNGDFEDYTTNSPFDYAWSSPSSGAEAFGFTATSTDIVQAFKNSGSACDQAAGAADGVHCWAGIPTTASTIQVANRTSPTADDGSLTAVRFKAEAAANNNLESGTYTTTVTATATTN